MRQLRIPLAIGLVVLLASILGNVYGVGATMLTLAGGVLVGIIALLWSSFENLTGDAPLSFEEALSLGAVTPEEEKKRAVLRTLKDLEYERSVGKISEEDFRQLSAQYRAEARRLLQSLDAELAPARAKADELLRERLAALPENERTTPSDPVIEDGAT